MTRRVLVLFTLSGLALLPLTACKTADSPATAADAPGPAAAPPAVPEVVVARASKATVGAQIEAPGTFVPWDEASISSQGAGPVLEVGIDEGTRVAKGDVLVRIDTTKSELAVKQAEAALAQARANFARAKSELDRKQQLLADRTIAQSTFDTFKAQYDLAAAGVDGSESALQLARQRLQDLTITAPFAGVIKERRVSPGQYLREGDVIAVLMRVDPLKLQFDVPEKYADRLSRGQQATATVAALPGEEFTGSVRLVFPSVSVQSRTIRVEAQVANPGYRLKPGFFASVRVAVGALDKSVVVPSSAVIRREGMEFVLRVEDGRANAVRVQTGVAVDGQTEIVTGLDENDQVVTAGQDLIRSGEQVRIKG